MNSTTCGQIRSALLALSALTFLSGCVTAESRIKAAARTKADAELVDTAIAAAQQLPDLPADCATREASGVRQGERLDVALVKTDRALGRANARVRRCAAWYGGLKGPQYTTGFQPVVY